MSSPAPKFMTRQDTPMSFVTPFTFNLAVTAPTGTTTQAWHKLKALLTSRGKFRLQVFFSSVLFSLAYRLMWSQGLLQLGQWCCQQIHGKVLVPQPLQVSPGTRDAILMTVGALALVVLTISWPFQLLAQQVLHSKCLAAKTIRYWGPRAGTIE